MSIVQEILHESYPAPLHTISYRGWGGVNLAEPVVQVEEQPELIFEVEGKHGSIQVLRSQNVTERKEDIHSLIARVLLMKQKRLSATGEQNQ